MAQRTCSIDACERKHYGRGLCKMHYLRAWRHARGQRHPTTLRERFEAKVATDGPTPANRPDLGPCWIWRAHVGVHGYGELRKDGAVRLAHRVAYELLVGPIPDGLTLDHLCRNRACVNPAHLEPVTMRENILRGTGVSTKNARKTHCPQGHPYDAENTSFYPNGWRRCKACHREEERRRRSR